MLWSGADWSQRSARGRRSRVAYTLSLIGGVGGTVTLLSYGYWMREAGWSGAERLPSARTDLTLSFALVFIFCFSMIFLSTQINWTGQILDEGPRLCLLLADRIGAGDRPDRPRRVPARVLGRGVLVGARRVSRRAVSLRRHGCTCGGGSRRAGSRARAYRAWAGYLALAAISALLVRRPVWLVFAYTVVGSMFFPFVISTLLWLNNSRHDVRAARNGVLVNGVLGAALLLYAYLALEAF